MTADFPATTVGADRPRVKVSAPAAAGPADVPRARRPTSAARANLALIRPAKLRGRPQRALNETSTRGLRLAPDGECERCRCAVARRVGGACSDDDPHAVRPAEHPP